jgi:MFS family permease
MEELKDFPKNNNNNDNNNDESTSIKYEKNNSPYRWLILLLASLMLVGMMWCFDTPSAVKSQMNEYMGHAEDFETEFALLFSFYSFPNIIFPFFGGYLIDKLGVRLCLVIFALLLLIGQVLFSFGLSIRNWPVMYLGRFIFGIGGESFGVANQAFLVNWFKGIFYSYITCFIFFC